MRTTFHHVLNRLARSLLLLLLAALGTIALMRLAPGYYADAREMDAQYAQTARADIQIRRQQDHSILASTIVLLNRLLHGDLGMSRQYGIPVLELIAPRLRVTAGLLARGLTAGWLFSFAIALPLSARPTRGSEMLLTISSAFLIAIPVGAMATFCLLADTGGPAIVIAVLVGTRNFKFLYRLLRQAWQTPCVLQARTQGISTWRIARSHLLPVIAPQVLALATMSLVIALGSAVPAEVIFNVPGVGQLAWAAAMNRDLPVMLATTLLMAACVAGAGMLAEPSALADGS